MKILVALGGNMISDPKIKGEPYGDQLGKIKNTARLLSKLVNEGHQLVITHGNGPQVGSLILQQEADIEGSTKLPMSILGALTQGQIGVALQHALINQLRAENVERSVYVIPTTVIIDENDPGFSTPTKPVGPYIDDVSKIERGKRKGYSYINNSDGFRRVVASPKPLLILESDLIKNILDRHDVAIAVGGGGTPTVDNGVLTMQDAVIDKDLASALLGKTINVDLLVILTNVEGVFSDFGTDNQQLISKISLEDAELMVNNSASMNGSMGPKITACVDFVKSGGEAVITSPEFLLDAINGNAGTQII